MKVSGSQLRSFIRTEVRKVLKEDRATSLMNQKPSRKKNTFSISPESKAFNDGCKELINNACIDAVANRYNLGEEDVEGALEDLNSDSALGGGQYHYDAFTGMHDVVNSLTGKQEPANKVMQLLKAACLEAVSAEYNLSIPEIRNAMKEVEHDQGLGGSQFNRWDVTLCAAAAKLLGLESTA